MKVHINLKEGFPYPLGATWDGSGVNFALYSRYAEAVYLCLFDYEDNQTEIACIPVRNRTNYIWHCYVEGIRPGQLYGYRVYGPYDPSKGLRFNPSKILLDPYALAIGRDIVWGDEHFGYKYPYRFDKKDTRDNASTAILGAVIDPAFTWGGDKQLRIPWKDTVIYEVHIKGFTMLNSLIPEKIRGTYLGFATEPVINYLKDLGITSIEFLPIQHSLTEYHLYKQGKRNYWGYNPISFFAPNPNYAYGKRVTDSINEFKTMVKILHQAGFEVILDVVYNHTAEGDHTGPTLSFRGIDNLSYYRVYEERPDLYLDFTGCGNTLNHQNHEVLRLIMDSLRYWITEMHIDGFRFDLASALARELYEVDRLTSFFAIIQQDPVISQVKLIAEPWDLGKDGYQVGNFPPGWSEWNGKFRDTVRKVINEYDHSLAEFITRISGSSDLYKKDDRKTYSSINFVTSHDGFTLRDLVSYNQKHNQENGFNNLDGFDLNYSNNYGVEGDTTENKIKIYRLKKQKLFLTTLLISQGVPMILAGDEINHTQRGNNNAFCQDNEISYLNWNLDEYAEELLTFTKYLFFLRKKNEVFRRNDFFLGEEKKIMEVKDVYWISPKGKEMQIEDWQNSMSLGMLLPSEFGERFDFYSALEGETFLVIFNLHKDNILFTLPEIIQTRWRIILDTNKFIFLNFGEESQEYILKLLYKEKSGQRFYEIIESLMSNGIIYASGESIMIPPDSILILKAERGWKEAHVKRSLRLKLLEILIKELGIQKKYYDLKGKEYQLNHRDLFKILRAFHLPVKDMASIETVYENYVNDKWMQEIIPVQVICEKDFIGIDIYIPEKIKTFSIEIIDNNKVLYNKEILSYQPLETHEISFSKTNKVKIIHTRLELNLKLPLGYYELLLKNENDIAARGNIIVYPDKCYNNQKIFTGVWIQLYALRSVSNLGIGDFGDLKKLALILKKYKFNLIGLSPLHLLPLSHPDLHSPYYPSSRLIIHPVYIHIFQMEEFLNSEKVKNKWKELIPEIEREKKNSIIDYEKVYQIKKLLLYEIYKEFITDPKYKSRYETFREYKNKNEYLEYHALYEAVMDVFKNVSFPKEIFIKDSEIYQQFYTQYSGKIEFYSYLFYVAETQFLELQKELLKNGIYLYIDLAVGSAPNHSEEVYFKEQFPHVISSRARAGSPPDDFTSEGQDWGITVFNPLYLKKYSFEPFIQLLRKNMWNQSLLRIDHIMWLYRLFWIVREGEEVSSTYVHYPSTELFGILALESRKNECIVIGEDLGVVPEEIRQILYEKHIYSWKVLYFEKHKDGYIDPNQYPIQSIATLNTHDLPTLGGFWSGKDLEERYRLGFIKSQEEFLNAMQNRREEKKLLIQMLEKKDLLKELDYQLTEDSIYDPIIAYLVHKSFAYCPSQIFLASLYDLIGDIQQPNMPGTTIEYPNWSIRYSVSIEELEENLYFQKIISALSDRLNET